MTDSLQPPVSKYKFTATIRGNSHQEIMDELISITRGGYLLASDYETRDAFDATGGRDHLVLEHTNPEMTPEKYKEELDAWWKASREEKKKA